VAPGAPVERPRRARWVLAPAVVGGLLFTAGLLVELRCAVGRCPDRATWGLFDLDGVGALPRLFTVAVFAGVAALSALAARRSDGPRARWWAMVAGGGVLLVVAKALSSHSALERDGGVLVTLGGGVLVAAVGLPLLWRAGVRWSVPGAGVVTAALAAYAVAALGLDQVSGLGGSLAAGPVLLASPVYLEEGGEAVTALVLLAAVARWVPRR
jgi:hypothetical protein